MPIILDGTNGISTPTVTYEGNVVITGTGRRILGDFSNTTATNRVMFQSNVTNGFTNVSIMGNGTSSSAALNVIANAADPSNSAYGSVQINSSAVLYQSGINGTATYLPIAMLTGGSERLRIDTSGRVMVATTSATESFQVGDGNSDTRISIRPSSAFALGVANGANFGGWFGAAGTDTLVFSNSGGTQRLRITNTGNVGIGTTSLAYVVTNRKILAINGGAGAGEGALLAFMQGGANKGYVFSIGPDMEYWNEAGTTTIGNNGANPIIFKTANTDRGRIDGNGRIIIQGSAPRYSSSLTINKVGNAYNLTSSVTGAGSEGHVVFENAGANAVGTIFTSGSSTLYNTSSDYRLKENIAPMTGALGVVSQLKPVTYTWKSNGEESQGFIAHELQAVVPECVTGEKDAVDATGKPVHQGVDTSFLVATLTAAIQEQQAIIETLKSRLDAAGL